MPRSGQYWWSEEVSALDSRLDIDSALDAFDRSKWKETVNKVLIQEREYPVDFDWGDSGPINRFR